mmetsp:Transcript_38772/g.153167  ORF Transcript_38772/g.153167 Transcript_38772/m.153167 type:complete len:84 (+) Transcript_38772:5696-5947(+)
MRGARPSTAAAPLGVATAVQRVADLVVSDLSTRRSEYTDLSIAFPRAARYLPESALCGGAALEKCATERIEYAEAKSNSTIRD